MILTNYELPVMASWMQLNGRRLDCNPYLSGAFEAKVRLERLRANKQPLSALTAGYSGGIYNGPMFVRNYVDDPKSGVPFLTSGSMLLADLSTVGLLRKKDALSTKLKHLRLEEGMTLISCSGTVGRTVYARPEMKGMWSSQDVLKVVPNPSKIRPGYLYAYLSSKFGLPLIVSGTYGAIIQHLEPQHIADLPVPRLGERFEQSINDYVNEAASLRSESSSELEQAEAALAIELGEPPFPDYTKMVGFAANSRDLSLYKRLGAFQYNPIATTLEKWLRNYRHGVALLSDITEDVFDVPMFKHIYVQEGNGIPFFTSGDLFDLDRKPQKFLSLTTKNISKYIIKQGWVLIARHGQLGGIIGRPQLCDSMLDKATTSDLVIRVVPKDGSATAGFLYTFFASKKYGYPLVVRHATGNSIPFLHPAYLKTTIVPCVDMKLQKELDDLVKNAFEKRNKATLLEDKARHMVEEAIEGGRF